jgi:hypothetical protein
LFICGSQVRTLGIFRDAMRQMHDDVLAERDDSAPRIAEVGLSRSSTLASGGGAKRTLPAGHGPEDMANSVHQELEYALQVRPRGAIHLFCNVSRASANYFVLRVTRQNLNTTFPFNIMLQPDIVLFERFFALFDEFLIAFQNFQFEVHQQLLYQIIPESRRNRQKTRAKLIQTYITLIVAWQCR